MYEKFYGLRERPFSLLPDPAYLFPSKQHRMAMTLLEYGLISEASFCVITGEIGAGKTTLIRNLLGQVGRNVTIGLISNTHRDFGDLLHWVLTAFNLPVAKTDKVSMYRTFMDFLIGEYAKNRRTVLIIDEAQNIEPQALEELRMLSNVNAEKHLVLQMILSGQPALREMLQRPDLEQFAQRITVDYHLASLNEEETVAYIRHRLGVAGGAPEIFDDSACRAIHRASGGVPRVINLLCDMALVYGFAGQERTISAAIVQELVADKSRGGLFRVPQTRTMSP
jgi:type II secretory pathway predicted ATPase ExeA